MHLVSVPIDYSENTRVLIDELREKLKTVDEPVGVSRIVRTAWTAHVDRDVKLQPGNGECNE